MVRSCSAFGCRNKWEEGSEIKFYKLPKNVELRELWLANIKRDGKLPRDENFFICSNHFEEDCFQRDLKVSRFSFFSFYQDYTALHVFL